MFEQIVESTEPITAGHHVLSASFDREGDTMPAEGTLTLHIGTTKVGEGRIKTQPGKFSIAGEGLNIGRDSGGADHRRLLRDVAVAVRRRHHRKAVVDVSGEPFVDLAQEAAMAFARD